MVLAGFPVVCPAASKVKIRGYITTRSNAETLMILDDKIHISASTHLDVENPSAAKALAATSLVCSSPAAE